MPLSEFHPAITKEKPESSQSKMANCSSDLSFMNDEFTELLWDNGPIVMHGQSNRPLKSSFHTALSSHSSVVQEKDSKDAAFPKIGHFRAIESKVNNFSPSGPLADIRMTAQDDDIVPCINYPIEDSLHNDYCSDLHNDFCSEFLSAYSEVHLNSINSQNNTVPAIRSICSGQAVRDSQNVEASEPSRIRTSQQFQLPQQYQSSVQSTKSRATDISTGSGSKAHQDGGGTSVMNFTHFLKPIAIARANLQSIDRLETNNKATTVMSSNPMESTVIESTSGLNSRTQGQLASVPPEMEPRSSCKPPQEVIFVKQSEAVCEEDSSKENNSCNTTNNCSRSPDRIQSPRFVASVALGRHETEKGHEAVVASSSMCSGSSAGAAPNDHKHGEKRKHREGEESGYQSEDLEDESVGLKKPASVRSPSTKRSRAAEVHNLSERRRRDRINEKMRALQELIPNCNKTDKASMLDEAIEYLKTLQMHVQIMSMGRGLCMPPMMMPHIRAPTMAHFSPMGVGMGMGIGLGYGMGMYDMNGSPGCPLIPVPPIHGPRFPYPSIPGMPSLHQMPGSTGLQMFRIPVQGFSMPMPHQPPSGSLSDTTASPTVSASGSKDQQQQNIKLEMKHKSSTANSQIPTSTQAAKECFKNCLGANECSTIS